MPSKTSIPSRGLAVLALIVALGLVACGDDDDPATATLDAPAHGATVFGGVEVSMTAEGVTIEEAGEVRNGAGHFHVVIDDGCVDPGTAVARDADHVHFGQGQGEGTVYLGPGEHELCLQVGDGAHTALDITDTVTVTAAIADDDQWCAVVAELDELFSATDESDADFATKQIGYENARRLIAQLDDAVDVLDASVRADITAALATGTAIATAFIDADTIESGIAAVEQVDRTPSEAGAVHIADTCGVDIDG